MPLIKTFVFIICFYPFLATCQINDIDFVKEKIELNYPGFKDKTTVLKFHQHVQKVIEESGTDTFQAISKIAYFFNDPHLRIIGSNNWLQKDSLQCDANRTSAISYLNKRGVKKKMEGYWLSDYNDCVIGIIYDRNGKNYTAYVIEKRGGKLIPGQVKGTLKQNLAGKYYADSYVTSSGKRAMMTVNFRNDSLFTAGSSNKWRKLKKYTPYMLSGLPEFSDDVQGKLLDSSTYLLIVPGCSMQNVVQIDSIINIDYETITHTKNLIIDVRGNVGGRSAIYRSLLPLVYTQPYANIRSSIYCTEDGARQQEEVVEEYKKQGMDTATQAIWAAYIKLMRDSIGKLVLNKSDTIKFDTVFAYPAHVGVIMNYATQSAAEMLVLMLRRSKKVTLFGEHSMGAVDYLSFYPMACPSGKYQLFMPISKRYIPPGEQPIDSKGISPQVPINENESDWVLFVKKYYEKR